MSDKSDSNVKVVKVSPYPISVTFGTPPTTFRGKILKLTLKGFLAEVENPQLTVHEKTEANFTLPVLGEDLKEPVLVVKTYDRMTGKTAGGVLVNRLLEFHFIHLAKEKDIRDFLKQIGQLK